MHRQRVSRELSRKVWVTLAVVVAYRLGAHVPLPGTSAANLTAGLDLGSLAYVFSGGALSRASLLSLGVMPYITGQIVCQMAGFAVPGLRERWQADEAGQLEMVRVCRWFAMALAVLEGVGYAMLCQRSGTLATDAFGTVGAVALVAFGLVVGEALVMLMGELVDQEGIGNGMSVMIFANVLSAVPAAIGQSVSGGPRAWALLALSLAFVVACALVICYVERGQRKVPVTLSRSAGPRGAILGQTTYVPIKVDTAGVVPVMFASAVLFLPSLVSQLVPRSSFWSALARTFTAAPGYWVLEVVIIVLFSWAYSIVVVDPDRLAESLARQGAYVQGVRPGADTAALFRDVIKGVAVPGSVFMALVAVVPQLLYAACGCPVLSVLGGTSLLIIIGVAIDVATRVAAELDDESYERGGLA